MISSSPSPTLHSSSPHHAAAPPRSHHHQYHHHHHHSHFSRGNPSQSPSSPQSLSRAQHSQQQIGTKGPSSTKTSTSSAQSTSSNPRATTTSSTNTIITYTRDASTQYSPPSAYPAPEPSLAARGKRKEPPPSVEHAPAPEDPIQLQVPKTEKQPQVVAPATLSQHAMSASGAAGSSQGGPSTEESGVAGGSSSSQASKRARTITNTVRKHMPAAYERADTKDLVQLIAAMLMELIRFNDDIPLQDGRLTRFHSRAPPGISVADYLQRLTTHATLSPPILLSMVFYIDRLCVLYPEFTISSLTVHRYLIASATVASKGLSDSFWTNNTYARVGGVSLKELALLELEFLWRLEWRIVPKPEVLVDYYRSLVERSEGFEMESAEEDEEAGEVNLISTSHDA